MFVCINASPVFSVVKRFCIVKTYIYILGSHRRIVAAEIPMAINKCNAQRQCLSIFLLWRSAHNGEGNNQNVVNGNDDMDCSIENSALLHVMYKPAMLLVSAANNNGG